MILDKDIKTKYLIADGLICDRACWLYSLIIRGSGVGSAKANLRNGGVATSPILLTGGADIYYICSLFFIHPIYFSKGLYIDQEAGIDEVFVQYRPEY